MRPRIGLALGAGGVRGLAHLGVIETLEKADIPIDAIAGSSVGALIGVLYASGHPVERLQELSRTLEWRRFVDVSAPRYGLLKGERFKALVRDLTRGKRLEDLAIPTAVIATDLKSGEMVVFTEGPADVAVRASIAIPGIFTPVFVEDKVLVDGGLVARVPAGVLRQMGVDVVIGVDVSPAPRVAEIRHIYDVLMRSLEIAGHHLIQCRSREADILMTPDMDGYRATVWVDDPEGLIETGRRAALAHVEVIRGKIKRLESVTSDAKA
ncbi:MAG: patatin-like phospholipase family protein [Hydrogenibacillus schlegelii]|uniref:Patatin-like phospholipase family protein n=1 Tax=Hydrogenibacillus schlegelii TaxID=1484 RepID=A0A947CXA5_HYDSH|nr:patatin-like phospholipase family protein [Hydrogenibacillus schlegelii]